MPENIKAQPLTEEIQRSYLDYAMSVIVSRALPDARDGLKPVARRILYSMWTQGLRSNTKFRKSAHVIGDVLGKYHPHGDIAVYDALARMVQEFSLRYPIIKGQGNWGSIDGDSPAAMRYTETKLASISDEMLSNIEKETVDKVPNYDDTRKEPTVLPAKLPQLLINGTLGIAVGMATNIPPHNLKEVVNAACELIDNPDATTDDLMKHVQGPDFPTGGTIFDIKEIKQAYSTGKGSIVTRAVAKIEEAKNGTHKIIVSEIPYLVNKAALITKIADQVKNKKIIGIRDLRDESDKDGIRIVIELKKDAYPKKVLNKLYSTTDLQKSFHVNILALVDRGRQPRVLNLKEALQEHITHRQEVTTRRVQFDLDRAKERAHILEGLQTALDHIDEIIATIKKSKDKELAHKNLKKNFKLSDAQATAILEMRLQTLSGLERKKIEDELEEKRKLIKELTAILKDKKKVLAIVKDEYQELVEKYGDERRTKVVKRAIGDFTTEDLVPDEPAIITLTHGGYIKRMAPDDYKVQGRGGKGTKGMTTKEEDMVEIMLSTTTHKRLLFFTNKGRVFSTQAHEIPAASRIAKGQAIPNFLELGPGESVTAMLTVPSDEEKEKAEYLIMATRDGVVKKTAVSDFTNIRKTGLKAINLKEDDKLEWVGPSGGKDQVLMATAQGQAIRFKETDIRPMGRTASGVRGITLKGEDQVVSMHVLKNSTMKDSSLLVIGEKGYGKRTKLSEYREQKRGGTGIKTANVTSKTGPLVGAAIVSKKDLGDTDIFIITTRGQIIRIAADNVSQTGRATQGVRVMKPTANSGQVTTFVLFLAHE